MRRSKSLTSCPPRPCQPDTAWRHSRRRCAVASGFRDRHVIELMDIEFDEDDEQ
jgi:hypothetical protein